MAQILNATNAYVSAGGGTYYSLKGQNHIINNVERNTYYDYLFTDYNSSAQGVTTNQYPIFNSIPNFVQSSSEPNYTIPVLINKNILSQRQNSYITANISTSGYVQIVEITTYMQNNVPYISVIGAQWSNANTMDLNSSTINIQNILSGNLTQAFNSNVYSTPINYNAPVESAFVDGVYNVDGQGNVTGNGIVYTGNSSNLIPWGLPLQTNGMKITITQYNNPSNVVSTNLGNYSYYRTDNNGVQQSFLGASIYTIDPTQLASNTLYSFSFNAQQQQPTYFM